ncbi:hypothetical protein DTL42_16865 [Bremerella cremea]|uniref:DUF4878 domain-containing protein n=1 Tax=Bremerella cremea TaxID=1031537 RepID=A0A368KRL2_9BACT|nr:hypothetical protein [Bremerella cremea]RCS44597.1 hypothetical protein DTL42_16865 [Bremerella cremea]
MPSIRLSLVSFLLLAFAAVAWGEDAAADPRETLATAIPEGIRLLEAEQYEEFLTKFVSPADLKMITARKSMDEFVNSFNERKAARVLKALKAIEGTKPKLDAAGTKANFVFKQEIDGKKSLTFVKVDKYWYLSNT